MSAPSRFCLLLAILTLATWPSLAQQTCQPPPVPAVPPAQGLLTVEPLTTGEWKARAFGRRPVVAPQGGWLALEQGRGKLVFFELATMTRKAEFSFPREISMVQFEADGTRLHVLTDNQMLYSMDLAAAQKETVAAGPRTP